MDYQFAGFVLGTTSLAVNTLLFFYVRRSERSQAKDKDLADFREDVDIRLDSQKDRILKLESNSHTPCSSDLGALHNKLEHRVTAVEQRIEDAPSHADLARLHQRIDAVASGISRLEGESTAQTRILNLVYESLITGGKS
jgi:hypothetical protein